MKKFGISLLLLWSLWPTGGVGLGNTPPRRDTLDIRELEHGEQLDASRLAVTRWTEEVEERGPRDQSAPFPSTTAAPILQAAGLSGSSGLQNRQIGDGDEDDENEDDKEDDDITPPPPPTKISSDPPCIGKCSSISASVSSSVSSSVAQNVTAAFEASLAALSTSASSAIQSAINAARPGGAPSTTADDGAPANTDTPQGPSTTDGASATPITATGDAGIVASIQASANSAVDAAKASASSSAQSAVEAAKARASAALASTNSAPAQGSNLTPGQIAGMVVGIAIASSLLSVLATFLLMRRYRKKQQESQSKFESDSPPGSRGQSQGQGRSLAALSQSLSLRNRISSFQMFTAPAAASNNLDRARGDPQPTSDSNHNSINGEFIPDVKQRLPPPPDADHPAMAMSHTARPLSMPSPDDSFHPVFPVSPVSSEGGGEPGRSERLPSSGLDGPGIGTAIGATPTKLALAREQSLSRKQRAQIVRVGSQRDRKDSIDVGASAAGASPLAMNPVASPSIIGPGINRIATFTELESLK